ncbi:type II secretion system protein PulF [Staphylococcus piscifermentans]|uniref:competence type IV pilus assembly protein ComGB n=1 Tax=Staphylococcus piscifermentans TaxID=70258 RepID=UPI000B9481EE|nr:competence type IV pilus assembly protein ComGB [Staphylococcus piscifermentans]RTX82764.1 type II secretion system F family protein [Staphylococcus piscifermentans]SNV03903.1 type II secretion system protein PulF [Staphylococcus piscifermentans]
MKRFSKDILKYSLVPSKKLNTKEQLILLYRLNILLEHGFTLIECFTFLNMHIQYKQKETAKEIIHLIKNGASCYSILKFLNFPRTIIMQIYFSEKYGQLTENLKDAYEFLNRKNETKQKLIKTIQYPLILIMVFMMMLFGINHFILPEFQQIYSTMDIHLSPTLRFLNNLIQHFPLIILSLLVLISIMSIFAYLVYRKLTIKQRLKFILKIPIVSKYFKLFKTYQVANELSLFFRNGIVLQQISKIYTEQNVDLFLNYIGNYTIDHIQKGLSLPEIFKSIGCFENDLIQFIEQGEKSGKLEVELTIYTQILLSQIETKMNKQIRLIQPVIFLLLGLLIVSLYLVIMLPMFDMMQSIK